MCRALIIEDSLIFREAFRTELLHRLPFILVQEAKDGREALEKINLMTPTIIFMDICLPGVNGLQLAQRIKKDFPKVRIAMLTGYDFPEYRRAASQHGADRYFLKEALNWKEVEEFISPHIYENLCELSRK